MALHLQRQIDRLKKLILALGATVEEQLQMAVKAVVKRDAALARQAINADDRIDAMELDVEEECLHTLALYQPVAFDLRYVVAVMKMNNDLERIGDLAVNVAEQAEFLSQSPEAGVVMPDFLSETAEKAQSMLKRSLDALVNIDPDLAQTVRVTDDEVDALHKRMHQVVEESMHTRPHETPRLIHYLSVSRYLERVADHAVNIAEDVIYMAQGQMLRHRRPHPLKEDAVAR
jgi:phosphate transport system protein